MKIILQCFILVFLSISQIKADLIKSINDLNELYQAGALTDEEFSKAKSKILDEKNKTSNDKVFLEDVSIDNYDLLYEPNDEKIEEWKRFSNSKKRFNVWAEIRKNDKYSSSWSFSWRSGYDLEFVMKQALDGCNKRVKNRPKRDFKRSDLCIPLFVNYPTLNEKVRKTTIKEKKKYTEEYYGKKKSENFFNKNSWVFD